MKKKTKKPIMSKYIPLFVCLLQEMSNNRALVFGAIWLAEKGHYGYCNQTNTTIGDSVGLNARVAGRHCDGLHKEGWIVDSDYKTRHKPHIRVTSQKARQFIVHSKELENAPQIPDDLPELQGIMPAVPTVQKVLQDKDIVLSVQDTVLSVQTYSTESTIIKLLVNKSKLLTNNNILSLVRKELSDSGTTDKQIELWLKKYNLDDIVTVLCLAYKTESRELNKANGKVMVFGAFFRTVIDNITQKVDVDEMERILTYKISGGEVYEIVEKEIWYATYFMGDLEKHLSDDELAGHGLKHPEQTREDGRSVAVMVPVKIRKKIENPLTEKSDYYDEKWRID